MEHLRQKRSELVTEAEAIRNAAEAGKRAFSDDELARLDEVDGELGRIERSLDATARVNETRAKSDENQQARAAATAPSGDTNAPAAGSLSTRERDPGHYRRNAQHSYFEDLAAEAAGNSQARERLTESHRAALDAMAPERRDLYLGATTGQEFVPPVYQQDMFQEKHEAAAVASGLVSNYDLPNTGRTITVPKQTGSAAVGITASGTPLNALTETDAAFGTATGTVYMVSGIQDIELVVAERGTPAIDAVLTRHFGALLGAFIDSMVINGSGSGQPTGLLNVSGIKSVTYTDASPTLPEVYPKMADLQTQIETSHFLPVSAWLTAPRRANKWGAELDSSNRPFIVPNPSLAQNSLAGYNGEAKPVAAGYTGFHMHGSPVYKAAKMPLTLGAGTNEDAIIGGDLQAAHLWLSPVIFEIDRSVNFKTGGLCVRARRYMCFVGDARPDAIGKITGTGLVAPTF